MFFKETDLNKKKMFTTVQVNDIINLFNDNIDNAKYAGREGWDVAQECCAKNASRCITVLYQLHLINDDELYKMCQEVTKAKYYTKWDDLVR